MNNSPHCIRHGGNFDCDFNHTYFRELEVSITTRVHGRSQYIRQVSIYSIIFVINNLTAMILFNILNSRFVPVILFWLYLLRELRRNISIINTILYSKIVGPLTVCIQYTYKHTYLIRINGHSV